MVVVFLDVVVVLVFVFNVDDLILVNDFEVEFFMLVIVGFFLEVFVFGMVVRVEVFVLYVCVF